MSAIATEHRHTEHPAGLQLLPADAHGAGAHGGAAQPQCTCPDYCELDHAND
jgi:hypothetical protein